MGSHAHLLFMTLPRVISGLYREVPLWQRAQAAWADSETRWLFDPSQVAYADWQDVGAALKVHGLATRRQDVRSWYMVSRGLQGRFKGDVRALIEVAGPASGAIIAYLEENRTTFPLLAGEVTARIWLDQLRRLGAVEIKEEPPLCLPPSERARRVARESGIELDEGPLPVHQLLALEVWTRLRKAERQRIVQVLETND